MLPFPDKKYQIIYADPPWKYDFPNTKHYKIEGHYESMETEDICSLSIPTESDAVLYLWATAPKLLEALRAMKAWGFEYKTHAIWDKVNKGLGYWFMGQHELLLVGVKGSFSPPSPELRVSSIIVCKKASHSDKPDQIRELIDKWYPDKTKLEMFYRDKKPLFPDNTWDVWGDEV